MCPDVLSMKFMLSESLEHSGHQHSPTPPPNEKNTSGCRGADHRGLRCVRVSESRDSRLVDWGTSWGRWGGPQPPCASVRSAASICAVTTGRRSDIWPATRSLFCTTAALISPDDGNMTVSGKAELSASA